MPRSEDTEFRERKEGLQNELLKEQEKHLYEGSFDGKF